MTTTITRESDQIWTARSDAPYWSDGNPINSRLAIDKGGALSSVAAQAVDRANGSRYILIDMIAIQRSEIVNRAKALKVGESFQIS